MTHDRRWREQVEENRDTIWDGEQASKKADGARESSPEEETLGLLDELVVGQSLTIIWDLEGPIYAFEEIVRCTTCGEGLTEVRLAFLDATTRRCPTCGRPPRA